MVVATIAFGLGWALVERAVAAGPGYASRMSEPPHKQAALPPATLPPATVWLIDGYNVLHAGLGPGAEQRRGEWWRRPNRERVRAAAERFPLVLEREGAEIWLVFDGSCPPDEPLETGPIHTVFAQPADDWLVDRVRRAETPESLAVVTADRQVAGRARHCGAHVVAPRAFLAACSGL